MAFMDAYLCWFIFIASYAAELKPPRNVDITTSGNNVTVTWTLPGESEIFTYLTLYSYGRMKKGAYIKPSQSSYAVTLESCKKYRLDMLCLYSNSRQSEKVVTTFWVTDNIFYSYINTDINIIWKTSLGHFYYVLSPANRTIYIVIEDIVPNTDMNKYKINSKDIEQINISVLNVSQNDSGIYQSVSTSSNVDGCCLLIITVHPQTPANFSLVSSTETSILVEWIPGYNDGQKQTFYLEHRVRGAKTWSLKEISHNTKQLTSLTYVLSGLQDSTLYELKMYSKNMLGRSLSTNIEIIQTKEKLDKETSSSGLYAVIGGVAGAITVLIIIVIIIKRKKDWSGGTRNNISNRSENNDEMSSRNQTTNDMYEDIREGTSDTRNEDLQQRAENMSDNNDEMSSPNKTTNDVYENTREDWSGGTRNSISNRSDNKDEMSSPNRTTNDVYENTREDTSDWSGGTRNIISNRSANNDEMSSPNRKTNDMYEDIREDTSDARNEDLQQRAENSSTRTYEMLGMKDTANTYTDLSSRQEQRQSESTTEHDTTLGD